MKKNYLIALFILACLNNVLHKPIRKKPKKTTELNRVSIIKTKKRLSKSRSNHFNFADQPSLNTVLEGIKKNQV
jgi:hypothetical protein